MPASTRTSWRKKFIEGRCFEAAQKIYIPGGPSPRALCRRPQRQALALLRAREGARRLLHGARRLGARPRLRRQRAPAGKIRRPRSGARERVGQPPFLARLQCRASGDERGLRHRQPLALPHGRHRGARPCRAAGMALRRQDRRRRQYRQGHLHPLPRRRGHGPRRLHRHPHGRPLPPGRTAPMPARATSTTCGAWPRTAASTSPSPTSRKNTSRSASGGRTRARR